jgi:hypothetical protein
MQGVFMGSGANNYIASIAAIAAIRTTLGDIFFTMERDSTMSAFASFDRDLDFVEKHLGFKVLERV